MTDPSSTSASAAGVVTRTASRDAAAIRLMVRRGGRTVPWGLSDCCWSCLLPSQSVAGRSAATANSAARGPDMPDVLRPSASGRLGFAVRVRAICCALFREVGPLPTGDWTSRVTTRRRNAHPRSVTADPRQKRQVRTPHDVSSSRARNCAPVACLIAVRRARHGAVSVVAWTLRICTGSARRSYISSGCPDLP